MTRHQKVRRKIRMFFRLESERARLRQKYAGNLQMLGQLSGDEFSRLFDAWCSAREAALDLHDFDRHEGIYA